MVRHELNYDSIAVSKPKVVGSAGPAYVVSLSCFCGSQFEGAGTSYVEASQKLHSAFAAHEKEIWSRGVLVKPH
jgi:hypothetical protein